MFDYNAVCEFVDFSKCSKSEVSPLLEYSSKLSDDIFSLVAYARLTFRHLVDPDQAVDRMKTLEGKVAAQIILTRDTSHPAFDAALDVVLSAYDLAGCQDKFYADFGVEREVT
jgi:hypothetical protein